MPLSEEHKFGQISRNIAARHMLNVIMDDRGYYRRAGTPPKPLTRWERIQRRLDDYHERIALAWRVLRGEDIHEDCY